MTGEWQTVGKVEEQGLVDSRLQLHYAAQLAAAVGNTLVPAVADYSHTALNWFAGGLFSGQVEGATPFRVGLDMAKVGLIVISHTQETASGHVSQNYHLPLNGHSFADRLAALQALISELGYAGAQVQPPSYQPGEFPAHPIAEGAAFAIKEDQAAELGRYYGNAALLLQAVSVQEAQASPVRVWPHHFDMATLVSLEPADGEQGRSVGVGFSPGDATYAQPYFYVTPWPYPPTAALPALRVGRWHTAAWVGAILTASDLLSDRHADQQARAQEFLDQAIAASHQLLAATN